jgi:DNA topoisomerase IB
VSGLKYEVTRKGNKILVRLYDGRAGWPTAERAASTLIEDGERLVRVGPYQHEPRVFHFTTEVPDGR